MSRGAAIIVVLAIAGAAVTAQQPVTISGRVVAADNSQPLRRARISTSTGDLERSILTDDDGRFDVAIRDTSQPLLVTKAGFASTVVDLRRTKPAATRPIEVRLSKSAAISGRVADQNGAPVLGVQVIARRLDGAEVDRTWSLQGETDDRGEYRIGGLSAGKYGLSLGSARLFNPDDVAASRDAWGVSRPAGMPVVLGTRFTVDAAAFVAVDLQPGDDVSAIDLTVSAWSSRDSQREMKALLERNRGQAPNGRITGAVVTTTGEGIAGAEVRATRSNVLETGQSVATRSSAVTTTDASGRFVVDLLDDGEYQVEVNKAAHAPSVTPSNGVDTVNRDSPQHREPEELRSNRGFCCDPIAARAGPRAPRADGARGTHEYKHHVIVWCLYSRVPLVPCAGRRPAPLLALSESEQIAQFVLCCPVPLCRDRPLSLTLDSRCDEPRRRASPRLVEVEHKPQRACGQFQVREQLRFVYRQYCGHRLHFDDHAIFDDQVVRGRRTLSRGTRHRSIPGDLGPGFGALRLRRR